MPKDKSQQQAAPEGSPPSPAAQGTPPVPDEEMSSLVSEEVHEQVEQAATQGSPPEPEEVLEPESHEPSPENQYGELKRLNDKLFSKIEQLETQIQTNQQAQSNPQFQTQPQPAATPVVPKGKPGDIAMQEVTAKIQKGEWSWDNDSYEILAFIGNRQAEIQNLQLQEQNRIAATRNQSQARAMEKAKSLGYNLQNNADPLGNATWQEVNRRAASIGMTAQQYLNAVPFAIEDCLNVVSGQLRPQNPNASRELRQEITPPVSDIPTAMRKPVEKPPEPTQVDKALSNRYGSKFETVNKIQNAVTNPNTFEILVPIDLD